LNWSFWHADDIAVAVSSDPRNRRGMLVIRKVVELVDRWLEENDFQMSTTKTKILYIAAENTVVRTQISVCVVLQFKWSTTQSFWASHSIINCWGVQVKDNKQRGHNALNIMKIIGHTK
jgi:hypothetical protein